MTRLSKFACAAAIACAASASHAATIMYQYSLVSGTITEAGVSDLTSTNGTFSLNVDDTGNLTPSSGTGDQPSLPGFQFSGMLPTPGLSAFATPLGNGLSGFRVSFLMLEPVAPPTDASDGLAFSVNSTAATTPAPVPLATMPIPAGLPMLVAGLGLLGVLQHRRRTARRATD